MLEEIHWSKARSNFYAETVLKTEENVNVARAAAYVALEEYPELDFEPVLGELERMANEVASLPDLPKDPTERCFAIVNRINNYLFVEKKFEPFQWVKPLSPSSDESPRVELWEEDYRIWLEYEEKTDEDQQESSETGEEAVLDDEQVESPEHFFLNKVLESRRGSAILIGIIYMTIAEHAGLPLTAAGFPGVFLLRPVEASGVPLFFIDPGRHGKVMTASECRRYCESAVRDVSEPWARPDPDFGRVEFVWSDSDSDHVGADGALLAFRSTFLAQVGARTIIGRVLSDLKLLYISSGCVHKALAVLDRILLLFPASPVDLRDRGIILYHFGRWTEARADLTAYLSDDPEDADVVEDLLSAIDDNLNRYE